MAHFAKINDNNVVLTILVVADKDTSNSEGVETESIGQAFLEKIANWPADKWIQTSYNTIKNTHRLGATPFRGNYAGVGYTWDEANQIFWRPQPYPSWVKNTTTADWDAPHNNKPELDTTQESQNAAKTHDWIHKWDEDAYQADNNTGWVIVDNGTPNEYLSRA